MRALRLKGFRFPKHPVAALAFVLCASVTSLALGQAPDSKEATRGEQLFNEATAALDAGNYGVACPKLEEVRSLLPDATGAAEALGECYEKLGKLASAAKQYASAVTLAKNSDQAPRAEKAQKNAERLRGLAGTVVLNLSEQARKTPGLALSLDGQKVTVDGDLTFPADAGDHTVSMSAPGYKPIQRKVNVKNGAQSVVEVASLTPESAPNEGNPTQGEGPGAGSDTGSAVTVRPWQLPVGIAAAGVGLIGVGVGAALGALALDKNAASNADGHCDATGCDDIGFALRTEARSFGDGSTAAIVVGGVVLAGGVVVAVLAPKSQKPVTVGVRGTGIVIRGGF